MKKPIILLVKIKALGLLVILASALLISCGGANYNYSFAKGKELDFSKGKWIFNDPVTNSRYPNILHDLALREFQEFVPESSLFEIFDLRRTKLIGETIPIKPTVEELKELRKYSDCDYLINIESEVLRDDMGSFAGSSTSRNEQTNKAIIHIEIYDLRTAKIVSKSTAIGKVEKTIDQDSTPWNFVTSGNSLAVNGTLKLIRRYKRNRLNK